MDGDSPESEVLHEDANGIPLHGIDATYTQRLSATVAELGLTDDPRRAVEEDIIHNIALCLSLPEAQAAFDRRRAELEDVKEKLETAHGLPAVMALVESAALVCMAVARVAKVRRAVIANQEQGLRAFEADFGSRN